VLHIEPWVIARELRHSDGGALVVKLYGHPTDQSAIERMRRGFGETCASFDASGDGQGIAAEGSGS
jgi:hypothetical protein